MDFRLVTRQLIRALRASRSQAGLSKRLGYRTNTLHTWESGRHTPTAAQLLWLAKRCGVDLNAAMIRFFRAEPPWLRECSPASKQGIVHLLAQARGRVTMTELSRASGSSRFALSRWLKGNAEPKAPDFLRLLECCTHRVADFVAVLVDPSDVPEVHAQWLRQRAARRAAYEMPWTQAVLRALELADYARLERHRPGWLAERIGISEEQERQCLELLVDTGQVRFDGKRWVAREVGAVDLRVEPGAARAQRRFWAEVGAERVVGNQGMFAYNVCGVSSRDLEQLENLQLEYLKHARAIIARSQPVQHVAVLQVQVFALDGFAAGGGGAEGPLEVSL